MGQLRELRGQCPAQPSRQVEAGIGEGQVASPAEIAPRRRGRGGRVAHEDEAAHEVPECTRSLALSCRRCPSPHPGSMTYLPDDTESDGAPANSERAGSRRALGCAFEIVETLVLTLLIYLVIHNFVAQPFEVQQSSMFPTIVDGEYILIDKLTPRFGGYDYGDVVVFNPPAGSGLDVQGIPFIKRIIGMPGDTVSLENGRVFITRPGESPVRIEEPYVVTEADGSTAPTICPREDCPQSWIVGDERVLRDGRQPSVEPGLAGLRTDRRGHHPRPRVAALLPARADRADRATGVPGARHRDGRPGSVIAGQARAGSSATIHASTSRS